MSRLPRLPFLALLLVLLSTTTSAAAQTGSWQLAVRPSRPTTADVVELTFSDESCPFTQYPSSVDVADGVIAIGYAGACDVRFPEAPSLVVGPLQAGTYEVRLDLAAGSVVLGRVTVTSGETPPRVGTGPTLRRLPGQETFLVVLSDVPGLLGCTTRSLVAEEVRYQGAVVHVFLRDVQFEETCAGPVFSGDLATAVTPQLFVEFYSVVVWYDDGRGGGPRPLGTVYTATGNPCGGGFGPPRLCLSDDRFTVSATWTTSDGSGTARPVPLTADSGAFWFFRPDNLELTVKVLDACAAFGRYWVFISGLTNQGVEIQVSDVVGQEQRTYRNHLGEGFEAIRDTDAFATCDAVP